eukprot:TRINITY_DN72228_c0_g1_i1.p1 TRINITY_DN72228_c0_g1~~TRINITY_DN72228_c0_g1_i1.p1  ORF type:complete len:463 (-),score=23.68 TRINITY_DN72228_c0_g1_i1:56-1444(-)
MASVHRSMWLVLNFMVGYSERRGISCEVEAGLTNHSSVTPTNAVDKTSDASVDVTSSLGLLTLTTPGNDTSTSLSELTQATSATPPRVWRRILKNGAFVGWGVDGGVFRYSLEGSKCGVDADKVAVKRASRGNLDQDIAIMNKIQALGGHPNIMRLYDSYNTEDETYMLMEFADMGRIGSALWSKLGGWKGWAGLLGHTQRRERRFRIVAKVALDLVRGLVFMHNHSFLHREIQPSNVLASGPDCKRQDSACKYFLGDLGRAVGIKNGVDGRIYKAGLAYHYHPPEVRYGATYDANVFGADATTSVQGRRAKFWSAQGDVWALGHALIAMLKGCGETKRHNNIRFWYQAPAQCSGQPWPHDTPQVLKDFFEKMTENEYKNRPVGASLEQQAENVYKAVLQVEDVPAPDTIKAVPSCISQCAALQCPFSSECNPKALAEQAMDDSQPKGECVDGKGAIVRSKS